jgi:hypothetical protein
MDGLEDEMFQFRFLFQFYRIVGWIEVSIDHDG